MIHFTCVSTQIFTFAVIPKHISAHISTIWQAIECLVYISDTRGMPFQACNKLEEEGLFFELVGFSAAEEWLALQAASAETFHSAAIRHTRIVVVCRVSSLLAIRLHFAVFQLVLWWVSLNVDCYWQTVYHFQPSSSLKPCVRHRHCKNILPFFGQWASDVNRTVSSLLTWCCLNGSCFSF